MELGELQRTWEEFGRIDPLWAILTDPSKKNNRWDPQEFFATGEAEIECLIDHVATLALSLRRGRALDFECGVGRLTQALCRHFEQCIAVDIAPSMIELAREYNRFGDRCQYHVNATDDLRLFENGRFDFFYSNIVLQHMPSEYSARYIRDFVRVLRPGGLAVFQLPSEVAHGPVGLPRDTMFKARIAVSPSALTAAPGAKRRGDEVQVSPEEPLVQCPRRDETDERWPSGSAGGPQALGGDHAIAHGHGARRARRIYPRAGHGPGARRVPVRVTAPLDSAPLRAAPQSAAARSATGLNQPKIAMYQIPRATVVDLVTAEGARVLDVKEYASAGAGLISYRYYVIK